MKNILQIIITLAIAIAVIHQLFVYFNWRDTQTLASADKYEKCVIKKHGITPSEYLTTNGTYPTCK